MLRDQKNIEILRKLKQGIISDELKEYSGWGGLRDSIYNPGIYRELKSFLSDIEINSIKQTLGSAYFTPRPMIEAMYAILKQHNFSGGLILEPAAGNGAFIEAMPSDIKAKSKITAVEIEVFSAQILRVLYPEVMVCQQGFETLKFDSKFDLVIGNPPYSSKSVCDLDYPDLKDFAIHHYFFAKSFRLLRQGGIVAMVLPQFCLDNQGSHVRNLIYKEGGRLLGAYRMPDSLFSDAKVTVDLVFIIKDRCANLTKWQGVNLYDEVAGRKIYINEYFSNNPANILGELKIIDAYGRKLLTCQGDNSAYDKLAGLVGLNNKKMQQIQEPSPTVKNENQAGNFELLPTEENFKILLKGIDLKMAALQEQKLQVLSMQKQFAAIAGAVKNI